MFERFVKFRRGDRQRYEEMDGEDGARSPNEVEIQEPSKSFSEDTFTVDQAVEMIGFGKFQIKLSMITGLAWMADAMEMMILAILSPALHCEWNLPGWKQALLTTVVFAGMMLSSAIWGKLCDQYGRKVELILCSVFTFYFGLLSAASPNFIWMLILRGLVGFGIGGAPQSVTLYAEFLPSRARARCVVMIELFWAIGACLVVLLSVFVMPTLGWRWLLGLSAIPLLFFTISCAWLPESVRFDMARGQVDKAYATLERIARDNGTAMPLGRLVDTAHASHSPTEPPTKRGQLRYLFVPELRVTTALLWFIWLANAFCYYGVVLMTTELFEAGDECHGGDSSQMGEPPCWLQCKLLTSKDYVDLLWTTAAEFPGLLITVTIIECVGRKKTMAGEFFVFAFFTYLVNMCTTRTVLTLFLFIGRAFISGGFQAAYVYTPEVYPTTTRALGLGSCSAMARIGALVTPFVAQVMLKESVYLAISTYGTLSVLGGIASMLLPIETKGRAMMESHKRPEERQRGAPIEVAQPPQLRH